MANHKYTPIREAVLSDRAFTCITPDAARQRIREHQSVCESTHITRVLEFCIIDGHPRTVLKRLCDTCGITIVSHIVIPSDAFHVKESNHG